MPTDPYSAGGGGSYSGGLGSGASPMAGGGGAGEKPGGPAPNNYGMKYAGSGDYQDGSGRVYHYGSNGFGTPDSGTDPFYSQTDKYGTKSVINQGAYADPYSDSTKFMLGQRQWGIDNRGAPTMKAAVLGPAATFSAANAGPGAMAGYNTIDQTYANQGRGYTMGLLDQLQAQSQGKGPSLATETLKSGMDQGLAAQMAAAASMKGVGNTALGARNVAMLGASQGQQLAQQGGLMRMQEQLNAQGQLGGLAAGLRAQDLGVAGQQAGLDQQIGLANQGALNQFSLANAAFGQQAAMANTGAQNQFALQQGQFDQGAAQNNLNSYLANQGMNDAMSQFYQRSLMGQNEADRQARMAYAGMMNANGQNAAQRGMVQGQFDANRTDKYVGAGMQAAGAAAAAAAASGGDSSSDERGKTDIGGATQQLDAFLSSYGKGENLQSPTATGSAIDPSRYTMALGTGAPSPQEASLSPGAMNASNFVTAPSGGGGGGGSSGPDIVGTAIKVAPFVAMAMSDVHSKEGFADGEKSLQDFLDNIGAHSYRYKDPNAPGAGAGRYVSPMAQELEKTPLGATAVKDTPTGKMVDYGKLGGTMLAAESMLNEKIKRLEKKVGK